MPHADPAAAAAAAPDLPSLDAAIVDCSACPRLVAWRATAAADPPRRFAGEHYWARPVPGYGDPGARILLVGLAPAADGGNRTGRVFTGDPSGEFLWRALHTAGLADRAVSRRADDGLRLFGVRVAAAVRCAPPANRLTPTEEATCRPFLVREIELLRDLRVIVALGDVAWRATFRALTSVGHATPRPVPRFAHGAEAAVGPYAVLAVYHPSPHNTYTGRLSAGMFDAVLGRAAAVAGDGGTPGPSPARG